MALRRSLLLLLLLLQVLLVTVLSVSAYLAETGRLAGDNVVEVNRSQREFDYFALSLQWPGTYCRGTRHCCSKNACCRGYVLVFCHGSSVSAQKLLIWKDFAFFFSLLFLTNLVCSFVDSSDTPTQFTIRKLFSSNFIFILRIQCLIFWCHLKLLLWLF